MSGMLWEVQKRDTEMQSEQMLMEKWQQQTPPTQGPHKPSICKKKKERQKKNKPTESKAETQYLWSTKGGCACQPKFPGMSPNASSATGFILTFLSDSVKPDSSYLPKTHFFVET